MQVYPLHGFFAKWIKWFKTHSQQINLSECKYIFTRIFANTQYPSHFYFQSHSAFGCLCCCLRSRNPWFEVMPGQRRAIHQSSVSNDTWPRLFVHKWLQGSHKRTMCSVCRAAKEVRCDNMMQGLHFVGTIENAPLTRNKNRAIRAILAAFQLLLELWETQILQEKNWQRKHWIFSEALNG